MGTTPSTFYGATRTMALLLGERVIIPRSGVIAEDAMAGAVLVETVGLWQTLLLYPIRNVLAEP